MRRYRPALLEMMISERAEAEAWLLAEWAPVRRWVIADRDYQPEPFQTIVTRLAEAVFGIWSNSSLAFIDEGQHARQEAWRSKHYPDDEPQPQTAWLVPDDGDTATAWRAHVEPLLQAAVEQALATFPLAHAGREIKAALTRTGSYERDQIEGAFEELYEGTGPSGLSEGAMEYLELCYDRDDEGWMCSAGGYPDVHGAELWKRYRVLPPEIMAILDAAEAAWVRDRDLPG